MQPITGLIPSAARPPVPVAGAEEPPKVQQPEADAPVRPLTPAMDEYVPEEKREPSGLYWPEKGEDGTPRICFDDPKKDEGADSPDQKAPARQAETCTGSTDKVDREIENLKREQEGLKRQIRSETDDARIKELEKKLAQVESELRQKDNDTYRRQHSTFS